MALSAATGFGLKVDETFAAYLADNNEERLKFLTSHILKRIGLLEKDLDNFQGGIYKDLASLTRAFAELDRNILSC